MRRKHPPRTQPRALTKDQRNLRREEHYTDGESDVKMARRLMSPNLARSMEIVGQLPHYRANFGQSHPSESTYHSSTHESPYLSTETG